MTLTVLSPGLSRRAPKPAPSFVRNGPESQQSTRAKMSLLDEQISNLVGSIAPQQKEIERLNAEYSLIQRSLVYSAETNERMAEISADMANLHRQIQPVVEQIELLNPKYRRLQKSISG